MTGRVVSTKMEKTVTVLVASRKTHPLYKKTYAWSKKYLADDQMGATLGDIVEIVKVRPISKRKHWAVIKILGKDVVALGEEVMKAKAEEAISEVMPEEVEEEVSAAEVAVESEKVEEKTEAKKEEKPKKAKKAVVKTAAKKETK